MHIDDNVGRGILSVWNDYPAEDTAFYERWYMTEHLPERFSTPGFLRGRRYRAIEADREYFTFYDLKDPDVLFSDAYIERLEHPTVWTMKIMSRWSGMIRTVCQRAVRVGDAVGAYAVVARFDQKAATSRGQAIEIKDRLADSGVVAVDLWHAAPRQNTASKEATARMGADQTITAALLIETTREASARNAMAALPKLLGPGAVPEAIGLYGLMTLQEAPRH